ncbi:hypothetical protein BI355_0008 [Companilactobacillus crustorum]|nr:hypothetical protein BI355_0008 [Companilactobacillus crustorum]
MVYKNRVDGKMPINSIYRKARKFSNMMNLRAFLMNLVLFITL